MGRKPKNPQHEPELSSLVMDLARAGCMMTWKGRTPFYQRGAGHKTAELWRVWGGAADSTARSRWLNFNPDTSKYTGSIEETEIKMLSILSGASDKDLIEGDPEELVDETHSDDEGLTRLAAAKLIYEHWRQEHKPLLDRAVTELRRVREKRKLLYGLNTRSTAAETVAATVSSRLGRKTEFLAGSYMSRRVLLEQALTSIVEAQSKEPVSSSVALIGGGAALSAPDQSNCFENSASARTRLIAQHELGADRDEIAMTIDAEPQSPKVMVDDIEYCIDPELRDGVDTHDTRLCTRKLVLEWQFDRADAVCLRGSRVDRIRAVERDNPGLILNSSFDSLYVRITISAPSGEVLPPSFRVAVDRLVLPEADIVPGTVHRFSLSLPDSAVVFGRLDDSTGRYHSLEAADDALQRPSRVAATLIEKLDARIRNRLEPDRTGSIRLGRRTAIAALPFEEGAP